MLNLEDTLHSSNILISWSSSFVMFFVTAYAPYKLIKILIKNKYFHSGTSVAIILGIAKTPFCLTAYMHMACPDIRAILIGVPGAFLFGIDLWIARVICDSAIPSLSSALDDWALRNRLNGYYVVEIIASSILFGLLGAIVDGWRLCPRLYEFVTTWLDRSRSSSDEHHVK